MHAIVVKRDELPHIIIQNETPGGVGDGGWWGIPEEEELSFIHSLYVYTSFFISPQIKFFFFVKIFEKIQNFLGI